MAAWIILHAVFGLIIGSFLNVVILRYGTGRGFNGRSACFSCGTRLSWSELVPVVSWLAQGGRCRTCKSRIAWQYPAVEAAVAAAFAIIAGASLPLITHVPALAAAALLIAIAVYDLRHTVIPDEWAYALAAVALMFGVLSLPTGSGMQEWGLMLAAGPATALPLWALWFVSRGTWMGLGDAKLMLGAGWLLGPAGGLVALFGGFVLGALVSVLVLLPLPLYRRATASVMHAIALDRRQAPHTMNTAGWEMESEVPFGPFLVASTLFVWFMQLYEIPTHQFLVFGF